MSNAIHTVRILGTFTTGHVLAEYVPAQGALAGKKRVGFLTKGGKACKSIPAHAEPVTPESPAESSTVVVAAEVTAEPAQSKTASKKRKSKGKRKSKKVASKGMKWQEFNAYCRETYGMTWTQAGVPWKAAKGRDLSMQRELASTYADMLADKPEYVTMQDGDNEVEVECLPTDKDGNTLPYQPESERGNPVPQYGKTEWACPSEEVIEEQARILRDDTQSFLRGIETRLA